MFSLISGLWQYWFSRPEVHVLIIGLDNAGKTTLLEAIKTTFTKKAGLPPERIPPTIGMNLARIVYRGTCVIFWDLGGQMRMRSIWERYYQEAHAVVFVVDSADVARLEESKLAYDAVCDHESLTGIPVMMIANKQDIEGSLSSEELYSNLHPLADSASRSKVFSVSALTGDGLKEAIARIVEEAQRTARSIET